MLKKISITNNKGDLNINIKGNKKYKYSNIYNLKIIGYNSKKYLWITTKKIKG